MLQQDGFIAFRTGRHNGDRHFTQLFQPQSWPSSYYIDIPFERGDAIQALVPLGDSLLVFGKLANAAVASRTTSASESSIA